jgi:phenylacetate-CoA ligase
MGDQAYWNAERETLAMEELRELQNERLRRAVSNAYHNAPIIRELWDEAGVTPADVRSVADLERAPVFRKDDTRERMIETGEPFGGRLARPMADLGEDGAMVGTSSGTTGTPTNVVLSARDREVAAECEARALWEMGLRPGDTFLSWILPNHLSSITWTDAAGKIGAVSTKINHIPGEVGRAVHAIEYLEPTVVKMISSPITDALNDHFAEEGRDPQAVFEPVEAVAWGGEPLLEQRRERIEREWGVEVYEFSGGLEPYWFPTETAAHGRWLRVDDDHFYVEALDPETGERVEEGRGELVVTPLSYDAMGHIRWAHDDIVEITRGEFEDGRVGTRIRFLGRVGDLVRVQGEELLPYDVLSHVNGIEEMPQDLFQFYAGSTEELRLRIGYDPEATADEAAFREELQSQLADTLGVPVRIADLTPEADLLELGPAHKIPRVTEE